jgi:uncharacterized protein YegL
VIPEGQPSRRLPVYILADCSGSMAGAPIVAVNQGLQMLTAEIFADPRAIETAAISVISFGGEARTEVPLTEAPRFKAPTLAAGGGTPLGGALRLLNQALDRDLKRPSGEQHTGDYKPLIFVFTDGGPTDSWESPARELKQRSVAKTADIIAVGCGQSVNVAMLGQLTETVMQMRDASAGSFAKLFKWLSQSIQRASQLKATPGEDAPATYAPPPEGIQEVKM